MRGCLNRSGIRAIGLLLLSLEAVAQQPYSEKYRPQFHFSPRQGWIGDPDGLIRFRDMYHLFWWGHAVSSDLIYWKELPRPMHGDDGSFAYFSGSAVVDLRNTSGFGSSTNPAMVAIYTAHRHTGGRETQCLSYSTDHLRFEYYAGNPILDVQSTSFRDPDVFWHAETHRWIMVVALPEQRKIRFYASADLKSWQFQSEFGPAGAREQIWEVPGLVQLPADGGFQKKKWVLFCGMGPNKEQYFVGDFDGARFTMDAATESFLARGTGLTGRVFADFETTDYAGWTITGNAFGLTPASGNSPFANSSGYLGDKFVSSWTAGRGDAATGTLTSTRFTITENCINFLIGGGNHPGQTCINLLINGVVVQSATGSNSDILRWAGWNVSKWKGQAAQLQIVDQFTGDWGHISIDHIMFSDVLLDHHREHAN